MTRISATLLALIAAASFGFAQEQQQGTPKFNEGLPVPDLAEALAEEDLAEEDEQETTRTVKGELRVKRDHDSIELQLKRYRLSAKDKLPLSVLAGREVEFVIEETGRGQARVVSSISPRGWSGGGVVRPSADGLELINADQRLKIVGLPEGVAQRIVNKKIDARGWVFEGTNELVFSGASARIVVATTKDGTPSETAWLNERTVDADGVATYGQRHTLNPGTPVFVFDIAAYRRAERDDAGKITKPGIWRKSLGDMVGPDIVLVRASVTEREGNGATGWIPLRKVAFGEVAGNPDQDPTPAISDVPQGQLPGQTTDPEVNVAGAAADEEEAKEAQQGLEGALLGGEPLTDETPDEELSDEDLAEEDEQQEATRTVKGELRVKRDHDSIELQLKRYRLSAKDKLPLSVLAGREVEFVIEETGRGQARVVSSISPRGWSGGGVVRPSADGLELINADQRLKIVGLPEGVAERIVNKKIDARGWVFEGTNELVFSGASARIVVATTKDGTPSETAWLNERTVDADGVATYGQRHTLNPGTPVFVFDIAAYRRAERDDAGKITKPGIWRKSLGDMVGPDIVLVRASVTEREGNGATGWIPLRKVAFGEVAGNPDQDPTPAITDVPAGELPGLGEDETPEPIQGELEDALGLEQSNAGAESSDLDQLIDGANADEVAVDLDPNAGQELLPAEENPHLPAVETDAQGNPQVDIDLGTPAGTTAMVTANELNVRSQPNHTSNAVLVALHGESVKVLEDNGDRWIKVELAPPSGYVYNRFLEPTRTQSTGKVRTFRVVPSHLKLRENPSMGDNVACYVMGGQELQAVGAKGNWVKIQQSEPVVGYVVRSALNLE